MNVSGFVSKEEFVSCVQERSTKLYTLPVHVLGAVLAIAVSFYATFWQKHDPLPIVFYLWSGDGWTVFAAEIIWLETINIGSFIGVLFLFRFAFKGLSISSLPFFISHRHGPSDFLQATYLLVSAVALTISVCGVDFVKGNRVGPLSLLEAFYYVVGVVSTTGSDILPASRASQVLAIAFSAITLLLAVFFFGEIEKIRTNRRVRFNGSRSELERAYDEITHLISNSNLIEEEKSRAFAFFVDKFDFDTADGITAAEIKMRSGDFSFALGGRPSRMLVYMRSQFDRTRKLF